MKVNPIQVAMPFRGMNKVDKPENKIANAKVQTAPAIKAKPSLELIQVMSGVKPRTIAKPTPVAHDNTQAAQAIKDAGCSINQNIIKMGYDNQLSNERQTTAINQGIYGLNTALDRNACAIEYNTRQQTCTLQNAIKDTSAASTNAIIAKLDAIEDSRKDREISTLTSQLAQAQARAERQAELAPIIAQVNNIRRNQPTTTTIEYPQLTAIPNTAFLGSLPINTGIWG